MKTHMAPWLRGLAHGLARGSAVRAGNLIGDARRVLAPREVAAVRRNLTGLGLAGAEADATSRAVFRAFGLFVLEFFVGLCVSPRWLAARWELDGREHLDRLGADPRGWILVGAHTGNWEHLGALAALTGRHIVAPVGTQFHPVLSGLVKRLKRRRGIVSVSPTAGLRGLAHALEQGDLVALPLDGGAFQRGVRVRLVRADARLAAGPARLGLLSGQPIVPVFSHRTGFLRQRVRVLAPIDPRAWGRNESVPLSQHLANLLGAHLEQTAGEWCIFRPVCEAGGLDADPVL
jgi:Kdo2-lipid IVA lauroyltransferase/acyltransferase